jgi:ubiquinone/menaquinone biosynthesis C-methylase UbiE
MSSPAPHSVAQHLHVAADDYDRAIRTLVPHYDEMIATALGLLDALVPAGARFLDLGGGTGALSDAILSARPGAHVTLLDVDVQMLAQARTRLGRFGERVSFVQASFHDPLPPADAVVASLALHHIDALDAKTRVYAAIRACLPAGGLLLNLDATVSADPVLAAQTFDAWAAAMGEHGIDDATARAHFAAWSKEDRYFSLHEELAALARAGFAQPECFWRRAPETIYGARA